MLRKRVGRDRYVPRTAVGHSGGSPPGEGGADSKQWTHHGPCTTLQTEPYLGPLLNITTDNYTEEISVREILR